MLLFWLENSILVRPPTAKPASYSGNAHGCTVAPLSKGFCFSINSHRHITSGVIGLLLSGGPSAVDGLVVAIIVDAVKAVGWGRFWANIGKKLLKTINPLITHRDAPAAIVFVAGGGGDKASSLNTGPSVVFGRMPQPMSGVSSDGLLSPNAPAVGCVAPSEVLGLNQGVGSALAGALPASATMFIVIPTVEDGEFAKSLAGQINHFHGEIIA